MRVLLIGFNPSTGEPATAISLGNLGAVLQAAGHRVTISSLGIGSRFSVASLRSLLGTVSPHLVGFGTYQRNLHGVRAIARLVKQELPATPVVLGGPQAMFLPDAALTAMPEIDHLCRGEGELALPALLEVLAGGGRDTPVPGMTSRRSDGGCITGPAVAPPADLDCYPSPWLSGLLDPAATPESIMLTSRGCPYGCVFCITPAAFGRRVRHHSVQRVLADITHVAKRGSGRLWFADPDFSSSRERVVRILEGVLQRGLRVEMWLETRADQVTGELLALMRRAGVKTLAMGLESASPAVHRYLGKSLEPEQVEWAARAAAEAGLEVELFSMYGLPGETLADAMATLQFVQRCGVAVRGNSNAQQMQLYFGSGLSTSYAGYGLRPLRDDAPPYLSIGSELETDWMSRKEIEQVKAAWRAASADGGKRIVS